MNSNLRPDVRLTDDLMYLVYEQIENLIKKNALNAVEYDFTKREDYGKEPDSRDRIVTDDSLWRIEIASGAESMTEIQQIVMNQLVYGDATIIMTDELIDTVIRPRVNRSLDGQGVDYVSETAFAFWREKRWPRVPSIPFLQLPEGFFDNESECSLLLDLTIDKNGKRMLAVHRLLKCAREWTISVSPPDQPNWTASFEKKEYSGRSVMMTLWMLLYLIPRVSEVQFVKRSFIYDVTTRGYMKADMNSRIITEKLTYVFYQYI